MKDAFLMLATLIIVAGLCVGCGKADRSEKEAAGIAKPNETENWEPEAAELPEGHTADDGHDHSDHDH
ncbi:MAG: hypothetical protein QGH15_08285 [Kiritimatiellia bacterium]|jgi:hypothetical protein|nr:hypothetical protein [Kiritimatiellia bacterium]